MKRCPQCNRTYADESFSFCLADGTLLSAPYDPNATLIIPAQPSSSPTASQIPPKKQQSPPLNPYNLEGLSDGEQRLHGDARRFAKLLISEINIYNESKIKLGRQNNDLYDRLKDDIDRSRAMYNKRVAPTVAKVFDYFSHELIKVLCEGDPSKLGNNYLFSG
jgi:hypothetical protein